MWYIFIDVFYKLVAIFYFSIVTLHWNKRWWDRFLSSLARPDPDFLLRVISTQWKSWPVGSLLLLHKSKKISNLKSRRCILHSGRIHMIDLDFIVFNMIEFSFKNINIKLLRRSQVHKYGVAIILKWISHTLKTRPWFLSLGGRV